MRRPLVFLILVVVVLTLTTPAALAKPGSRMDLVCWVTPQGVEQSAYFMMTGSGIVHRFMEDGKHDIYKPATNLGMPAEGMPPESGWTLWQAKAHDPCENPTPVSHEQYLAPGHYYWHWHN